MTRIIITPQIACQLDTAPFPDHDLTTIYPLSGAIDLGVDQDASACTLLLAAKPSAADTNVRLYVDGDLAFNGAIQSISPQADGTVRLVAAGTMIKLRGAWGGEDRVYNADTGATDTSTAQNVVEASGIDVSLTSIEGADLPIGVAQDVIIHGGTPDPLTGQATSADVMIDLIRRLDRAVVPNYVTYDTPIGAVYRRPRTLSGSIASFADGEGGNAWDIAVEDGGTASIVNKTLVTGLPIAGVPLQAEYHESNAYLTAPWEYNPETIDAPILETQDDCDALALWNTQAKNGRKRTVTWTTWLQIAAYLAATVTVSGVRAGLASQDVFVTQLRLAWDGKDATTTFTGEYRA